MARIQTLQPSFSSGEISPRLYGRADIAKYQSAAEAIENYIVRPEGGLMRRHGSRFAGEVTTHAKKPRLREFIFSNADKIMLVFEDLLLRFYKGTAPITSASNTISGITKANPAVLTYVGADNFANGDRVLVTSVSGMGQVNNREFTVAGLNAGANTFQLSGENSTGYDTYTAGGAVSKIYSIPTTYLEADLPTLYFAQSADVVYITHPSYAPRKLSRASDTSWALATVAQSKGPFASLNTDDTVRVLCSGTNRQPGDSISIQANSAVFTANHVGSYFRMQELYLSDNAVYPYGTDRANNVQATVTDQCSNDGNVYSCIEVLGATNLCGQAPPTHTIGDAWDGPQRTTQRAKWRFLHSRWAIISLDTFSDSKNMTGTIVTYLCDGLAPSSKAITGCVNSGGLFRVTSAAHGYNEGDYVTIAGVGGTTGANGDWKIINVATNTFDLAGSVFAGVYTPATGTVKRYSTWLWQFGAFSAARGYPNCVALHEQRLTFGNTSAQPTGVWASKSGDYENFYPGTNDDDSISYNIAANQADPIRWMASANDLILGTLGQEMAAYGGGQGDPITPSNTRIVPQSGEGSANIQPLKAGTDLIFVNRAARKLFSFNFQTPVNAYQAVDLLELAEHLAPTNKTIMRVAWAKNPCSTLWVLRSDGSLISATYRPDQQLLAWTQHPLASGSVIEDIAVMPSSDSTTDDLWMAVRRTINGATKRYIEYLAPPFEPTSPTDKATMGFVDCALQYSGASTTTLTGLFHLEGLTVKVVGNGALQSDRVVANGKITLDSAITQGWVGLGYTSRLRTLRPEGAGQVTAQGKTKRTPRVTVRVHNSIGGTIGPGDQSLMDELVKRDASDPMDASPPLRSGDFDAFIASDFDLDGRIAIVQSDPLPLDILAIMPLQSVSES